MNGRKLKNSESKEGREIYFGYLKTERERNKRLGFGNGGINIERKEMERQRREIIYNERHSIKDNGTKKESLPTMEISKELWED